MSIDAIGPLVSTIDPLKHDLPDNAGRPDAAQRAADNPVEIARQDATVVTVSEEVIAERRAADDLALRDATEAANRSGATDANRHEAVGDVARADAAAVQEAVDALLEASRENSALNSEALMAERDRAADSDASDRKVAGADANQQETVDVGTSNAGIQGAYGGLSSPTTGVPPLRQPGVSLFA